MKALAIVIAALLLGGDGLRSSHIQDPGGVLHDSTSNFVACDVDPNGEVYIINEANNQIVTFSSERKNRFSTGGYGWGEEGFDQPSDLVAPNGLNVYVADFGNHRVQRFDSKLNVVSSLFLRDDPDPQRRFGFPKSIAVDRFGALYILDGENKRVLKVVNADDVVLAFGGIEGGEGSLKNPRKIRVSDDDLIYILDDSRIIIYDIFGNYYKTFDQVFDNVVGIAVDGDTVYLYNTVNGWQLTDKATTIRTFDLPTTIGIDWAAVRDIAVRSGVLWVLTQHDLIKQHVHEIF